MSSKAPEDAIVRGHDERNLASLVLIPTQERLPKDLLVLERTVLTPSGNLIRLMCQGMQGIGLPRGLDNDFIVALTNRFIEMDCPQDNVVFATAYSLLKSAGLDTSAQYYKALDAGLKRLKNASFTVTEGWFDAEEQRYTTAIFNIIDGLSFTHGERGMDRKTVLRIRLSEQIADSIRSGHIKPLNLSLYHKLKTTGSRTLYRLLDAQLFEVTRSGDAKTFTLDLPLVSWAVNCGILETRPAHIKAHLERMHAPLLDIGYLKDVAFSGRGQHTRVHYVYGEASSPAKPEHVELLLKYGVQRAQAEKAARELGESVFVVVQKFEERLARPGEKIQNTGAYLAKLLRDASSILEAEQTRELEARRLQTARRDKKLALAREAERQAELFDGQQHDRLEHLRGEAAADYILSSFYTQTLLKKGVSLAELEQFKRLIVDGAVPPTQAYQAVLKALLPQASDALLDLRRLLSA